MRKIALAFLTSLILAAGYGQAAAAAPPNDAAALSGLHQAKAIFLVNVRTPAAVAHLMTVIGKTQAGLQRQKVRAHIIVVFVGPDVAFLTRARRGIPYTDERMVANIQSEIHTLAARGIRFQACNIALHGMDVAPAALIPEVAPVGNGFISVIAYQEKGYALVPVY